MNTFQQHIPAFVEIGTPPIFKFNNTDELLALDVVQLYCKSPDFLHFAKFGNLLMVVADDGFHWFVVGYIADASTIDLPVWSGAKYRAELPDGTRVTLGQEVHSSCGDVLTLKDGTKARDLRVYKQETDTRFLEK